MPPTTYDGAMPSYEGQHVTIYCPLAKKRCTRIAKYRGTSLLFFCYHSAPPRPPAIIQKFTKAKK